MKPLTIAELSRGGVFHNRSLVRASGDFTRHAGKYLRFEKCRLEDTWWHDQHLQIEVENSECWENRFHNCVLSGSAFSQGPMNIGFRRCQLPGVRFESLRLMDCTFTRTDFRNTVWKNVIIAASDFNNSDLRGVDWADTVISAGTDFNQSWATSADLMF